MNTTSHKWAAWDTQQIIKYLGKYTEQSAPGKCSAHRRKKIRTLQTILKQRKKTERLLLAGI